MKFFALDKTNLLIAMIAVCLTLLIRLSVYTDDCNLLIVSATFLLIYVSLSLIYLVGRKFL